MPDSRKKLYDLISSEYNLGSFEQFNAKMDSPESRKKLYGLVSQKFNLGSFETFESKVAPKKKEASSPPAPKAAATKSKSVDSILGLPPNGLFDDPAQAIFKPQGENDLQKEARLRKYLSSVKVTEKNMDEVNAKTDELSALVSKRKQTAETNRRNRVQQLEGDFYKAVAGDDDDAIAEQRLKDKLEVNGAWNNTVHYAKKAYNVIVQGIGTAMNNPATGIMLQTDTDPLADEKKQVRAEAAKRKEKLTPTEIETRAKQLFKEKEKDNLYMDRANDFLETLSREDKDLLKQDRAMKATHLKDENAKVLKAVSALQTMGEAKVQAATELAEQVAEYQKANKPIPQDLAKRFDDARNELTKIAGNLQKYENQILKNTSDLGTAEQEFDLFKREYGDLMNFGGNFAISVGELANGIAGFTTWAGRMQGGVQGLWAIEGQQQVDQWSKDLQGARETLRKPVESVESVEGFVNYASDLLANQLPNLAATYTGVGGLAVIGASSAGKKATEMQAEVMRGEANYSPAQMAIAPVLYGGAEVVGELPTFSILKKGGRVLAAVGRTESDLIKKTVAQRAKDWAKDFAIDMSKENVAEQFTNFTQNFTDKYLLKKEGVGLLDNAGDVFKDTMTLTSILNAAPHVFGAVAKQFQTKNDFAALDENARKIIEFSQQLNTPGISDTEKAFIQKQIDKATGESSKIMANTIDKIATMPEELYNEVVNINSKAGELKAQAKAISEGNLSNKEVLLEALGKEYKTLQEKRSNIIEGKATLVDALPEAEQSRFKTQAKNELIAEGATAGNAAAEVDEAEITKRANAIYKAEKLTNITAMPETTVEEVNSKSETLLRAVAERMKELTVARVPKDKWAEDSELVTLRNQMQSTGVSLKNIENNALQPAAEIKQEAQPQAEEQTEVLEVAEQIAQIEESPEAVLQEVTDMEVNQAAEAAEEIESYAESLEAKKPELKKLRKGFNFGGFSAKDIGKRFTGNIDGSEATVFVSDVLEDRLIVRTFIEGKPEEQQLTFKTPEELSSFMAGLQEMKPETGQKTDPFAPGSQVTWEGEERTISRAVKVGNEMKYEVDLGEGKAVWTNKETLEKENPIQEPKKEPAKKSQKEQVKEVLEDSETPKSIKEISEQTGILEPNVRRILGVGTKDGTFERVDAGVYVLKTKDGKQAAYIEAGDAKETLARMAEEGRKFDMVFLDPAYFSKALIGGNRGIKKWEFITPEDFASVMKSVSMMVDNDNHVYVMLSGAATAQKDMLKYVDGVIDAGFKVVGEGGYQKTFKDGSPVTNVRGEVAKPERLILVTKSGNARAGEIPVSLNFRFVRPSVKNSYQTEKPKELLKALIKQSTFEGEKILDPFAGSGVTGEQGVEEKREVTLVEKRPEVVEDIIKPRVEKAIEKRNEELPEPNPTPDGGVQPGVERSKAEKKDTEIQPSTKPGEGEAKAEKIGSDSYRSGKNQVSGKSRTITIADGSKIEGRYKVVSANDIIASHNESSFSKSEGYPTNSRGETINDRDYQRDSNAQSEVIKMAQNFDARAIQQTPVVSPDGIVMDGNNRTMSRKLAAKNGTDALYLEALTQEADMYGINPTDISGIENPMLVFEASTVLPYTTTTLAKFNKVDKKEKSAAGKAVEFSKTLTDKARRQIAQMYENAKAPSDVTSEAKNAKQLRDILLDNGIIQSNEIPRYFDVDKGVMTKEGTALMENIALGSAFSENVINTLNLPGMGDVRKTILGSLVSLINNAALDRPHRLTKELGRAIEIIYELKKSKLTIDDYLAQPDMFGEKLQPNIDEYAVTLALSEPKFKEWLTAYNNNVGQPNLFKENGETITTKRDLTNEKILQQRKQVPGNLRGDAAGNEGAVRGENRTPGDQRPNESGDSENVAAGSAGLQRRADRRESVNNGDNRESSSNSGRTQNTRLERPGIVIQAESKLPPTEDFVADNYDIDDAQRQGVNSILSLFKKGGKAFLLADGTGVGKTRQILVTAAEYRKNFRNKNVLIITENKTILAKNFGKDAQALGIKMSDFESGSYDDLRDGKVGTGNYGLVIFDEAHNLKNQESGKAIAAGNLATEHTLHVTATPMDTLAGAVYFISEVSGVTPERAYDMLGLRVTTDIDPHTRKLVKKVVLQEGVSGQDVANNIIKIRDEMIEKGSMLRREYPFFGEFVEDKASLTDKQADDLSSIQEYWDDQIEGAESRVEKMGFAGQKSGEMSRFSEFTKLNYTYSQVVAAIREGQKVVVIAEGVNESYIKGLDKTIPGFLTELSNRLEAQGFSVAKIFGGADKGKANDQFQSNQVDVVLGTPKSASTGIDLDDQIGDFPRTLFMVTPNYSGNIFQQILGRVSRRNTKSAATIRLLYNDSVSDTRRREIVEGKLKTLKAIQEGRIEDSIELDGSLAGNNEAIPVVNNFELEDISEKAFVVKGDTKDIKQQLKELGAKPHMKSGKFNGWMFPIKRKAEVAEFLNSLNNGITGQNSSQDRTRSLVHERIQPARQQAANAPKKLNQIIADVAKGLKATLIYGRAGRRGVAGTYFSSSTLVKIMRAGDLDTVAHELGHLLDDRHKLFDNVPGDIVEKVNDQLKWFSERGGSNPSGSLSPEKKIEYLQREGLAEFIRAYVVNPAQAKFTAPELYNYFENALPAETLEVMQKFSADVIDFTNAGRGQQIDSNVESLDAKESKSFRQWLESFKRTNSFAVSPYDKLVARMGNSLHVANRGFKFLTERAGMSKGEILPEHDFELLARLFAGANGKVNTMLKSGLRDAKNNLRLDSTGKAMNVEYLVEGLDASSETTLREEMNEVIRFLIAERTLEYARKFGRMDNLSGIGGGIDNDVTVAIGYLDEFSRLESEDVAKYDRIKEAARRYREFADAGLRYMVEKGRISEESYQLIKENNQFYVSLARTKESAPLEEALDFLNTGNSLATVKDVLKKAKGGTSVIQNPYSSLLRNTRDMIQESDRNEVLQSFVEPLSKIREMGDGEPINFAEIGYRAVKGDPFTRDIYVNGEVQTWGFAPDIYEALVGMESISDHPLIDLAAKPAQLIRFTVTNFPTFALRNAVRDTASRLVVTETGGGIKNLGGLRDLLHNATDRELFELYGGSQSGFYLTDKKAYKQRMEEAVKELTKKGGIVLDPRMIGRGYRKILERGENLNRVAEFKSAYRKAKKELGMDDYNAGLYAAYHARDLMDFAVAGHWMRVVNRIVPFSNAAVQGLRKTTRTAANNPGSFAVRTALFTVLPTLAFRALVAATGDEEEYEELPVYMRDLFWNFKVGTQWVSIPKPFEQGMVSTVVDRGISKARGYENAADGLAFSLVKTLAPFDEATVLGGLKPVVEASFNHSVFLDQPIVYPREENLIREKRAGAGKASRIGQGISEGMYLNGYGWDVDPRKVDHVLKGYGTYMADWAMTIGDLGKEDSRYKFNWKKTGFANEVPLSNARSVTAVYKLATELDKWNSSDVKRLRGMIEQTYALDDGPLKRMKTKEVYYTAKQIRNKFELEKLKIKAGE
jgi:hypothetical protein